MSMNLRWARWIQASINKHFETNLVATATLPYVVHYHGKAPEYEKERLILEVRVDAGDWEELQKNIFTGVYEINIACSSHIDHKDIYKIYDLIGHACKAMTKTISVFKYGAEPEDDSSFLACFQRLGGRDDVKCHYFGRVEPTLQFVQATVEAHYKIQLEGENDG